MTAQHLQAELVEVEEGVSRFARAIALKRATVTAIVGGVLVFAADHGWITGSLADTINHDVASAFAFLTTVGAGYWIHRGTTPADQALGPVNAAGQKLVPDPAPAAAFEADPDEDAAAIGAAFTDPL